MKSLPTTNTSVEKNQETTSFDNSLKELALEAKLLFKALDDTSAKIRELETSLSNLKAHFPFRRLINEEKESIHKIVEECHAAVCPYGHHYFTKVYWYISWEADENSKNFRLFLISEEKEIIEYPVATDEYESIEFQVRNLIKKPLIETDLQTRLKYSEHLVPFIDSFKEFLRNCRTSIEHGKLPY